MHLAILFSGGLATRAVINPPEKKRANRTSLCEGMQDRGGPGGALAPQYLADQLTLFKLGEGRLSPPITTGPPNVFHLPASLTYYLHQLELPLYHDSI